MSVQEEQAAIGALRESFRAAVDGAGEPLATPVPRMPLKFETLADEVNLLALRALLDFGREYRALLAQEAPSMPASFSELQTFGVLHMHISGETLDADFLRKARARNLAQHFSFPIDREEAVMLDVIFKVVDGPLKPFADTMVEVLRSTGLALEQLGSPSLGAYVVDTCGSMGCAEAVEHLCSVFEGFADRAEGPEGEPVLLARKATILVETLCDRFRDDCAADPAHPLAELVKDAPAQVPVKADPELVACMVKAGVLSLPAQMAKATEAPDAARQAELDALFDKARAKCLAVARDVSQAVPGSTMRDLDAFVRRTYSHAEGDEGFDFPKSVHF